MFLGQNAAQDDGDMACGRILTQLLQQLPTINTGKHNIKDDDLWLHVSGGRQRQPWLPAGVEGIAGTCHIAAKQLNGVGIVVNHQDCHLLGESERQDNDASLIPL